MSAYRVAPPGFSREQWREFQERGIVILEDALTPEEVAYYRDAVDRVCSRDPGYVEGTTDYRVSNAVEADPAIAELIDHPRHVGYAYDLYGEMLKIIRSDIFVRPRDTDSNMWHPDSPRATPYPGVRARAAAAHERRLLAYRPAARSDGQLRLPARQPPAAVPGRLLLA